MHAYGLVSDAGVMTFCATLAADLQEHLYILTADKEGVWAIASLAMTLDLIINPSRIMQPHDTDQMHAFIWARTNTSSRLNKAV